MPRRAYGQHLTKEPTVPNRDAMPALLDSDVDAFLEGFAEPLRLPRVAPHDGYEWEQRQAVTDVLGRCPDETWSTRSGEEPRPLPFASRAGLRPRAGLRSF